MVISYGEIWFAKENSKHIKPREITLYYGVSCLVRVLFLMASLFNWQEPGMTNPALAERKLA
jgi:hypothetical protein